MMGFPKKRPEEFLVVHAPPQPANRLGREGANPQIDALPADVSRVAAVLRAASDPQQRADVMAAIQARFGNAFATRVVEAAQRKADREPPPDEPKKGGGS
jgi:hypothetical protein